MKKIVLNKDKKLQFFFIALCIFIFTIPFENRYSNIGLILMIISSLILFDIKSIKKVVNNSIWKILLLNLIWFLIGLIFIKEGLLDDYSSRVGRYFLIVFLPVLIAPVVFLTKKQQKALLLIFAFSIIFGMCINFINAIFFTQLENINPFGYSYFSKGMGGDIHPAYLSMFAVFSFFIVLDELFLKKKRVLKILYAILAIFLFCSVFVLYARMPIIAMLVLLPLYVLFKTFKKKSFKYLLVIVIIIILSGFLLKLVLSENQYIQIQERIINNFKLGLSIRLETWKCSWTVFKDNSWLFGVGSGNVQPLLNNCYNNNYLTIQYFSNYNSHNEYLMILVRNGVVGVLLWLALLIYSLYVSIKSNDILGIIFILLFSICGLTEVYLTRIWGVLFFGTIFGLIIILNQNDDKKND